MVTAFATTSGVDRCFQIHEKTVSLRRHLKLAETNSNVFRGDADKKFTRRLNMIRLLLYSQDLSLHCLLGPTLGAEFSVVIERRMEKIREILARKQCDVLLLDLDSGTFPAQQQLGFFDEIRN